MDAASAAAESSGGMIIERHDIGRVTLTVLFIGGLLFASFWIVRPFLPAILWATTLVLATWPLLLRVQRRVGGRRWLAVVVMTTALLLILIIPLWLAVSTLITNIGVIGDLARAILSLRLPSPPGWLTQIPLIGPGTAEAWQKLSAGGAQDLASRLAPYAGALTRWMVSAAGGLGEMLLHMVLTTAIAAVMYARGEEAAAAMLLFGRRLAEERGEKAMLLAGRAIRSVALGVVVTAFAQSIIGGIGLWIVGIPFAAVLTALMFVLCLVQLGPGLVLVPAVIWMYRSDDASWATILLVLTVIAMTIDQFIRPMLIRKGADLSLLLILPGVVGGLIAFGILGIFIGPTVLAVAYTLLAAWLNEGRDPALPTVTR